jgi:acetylornithine deacetylase/succinyl-diaminopimelate desuccinylase-like protein
MDLDAALRLAREGRAQAEAELLEELRIPSVSTLPEHRADVRRNADWLVGRLRRLGLEVELVEGEGGEGHPVVLAEWAGRPGAPTLTVYGHYDVQPADPLDLWTSPPFDPVVRDGLVFARGSADSKGNHLAALKAVEHALAAGGPPVNVRFLIEGEEESAGHTLRDLLRARRAELATDWVLVWDGGFTAEGRPTLVVGLRGLLYTELHARGAAADLHSGSFGGVAPNPLNTLAWALAELKGRDGRVRIPGFYDRVRQVPQEERRDWPGGPDYELALLGLAGARALEGEAGFEPVERQWARPTLDVNGLLGGFTGEGQKTVIPAAGMAKVSMRLVPDQDPDEIFESMREWLRGLESPGVELELRKLDAAPPVLCAEPHRGLDALGTAFRDAFGREPARVRMGASIPVVAHLREQLGAPLMVSGLAQPGSAAHSPDERFSLDHFHRGIEALLRLLHGLGPAS